MDLVGQLASQLGLPQGQAQGLAGGLILSVSENIPEEWKKLLLKK